MANYLESLLGEDELQQAKNQALSSGLMQAGFAGLLGSGPSLLPTSAGQAIGQAGLAGMSAYDSVLQGAEDQAVKGMEMRGLQNEKAQEQMFMQELQGLQGKGQIRQSDILNLVTKYPTLSKNIIPALQGMMPKESAPVNLQFDAATGTVFNPRTGQIQYNQNPNQPTASNIVGSPQEKATQMRAIGDTFAATDPKKAESYYNAAEKMSPQEKVTKATDTQLAATGYFNRMSQAESILNPLEQQKEYPMYGAGLAGSLPFVGDVARNAVMSAGQQQYQQAAMDWVRSKLRKESGAVIGEDEARDEFKLYFPQVGDTDKVIEQKRQARATATKAMKEQSSLAKVQESAPPDMATQARQELERRARGGQ